MRRALRPMPVVGLLAVAVLAAWASLRVIWPRAESHQGNEQGLAPATPSDSADIEPHAEETRPGDAIAVSRGGYLALLEILGEAVEGSERAAGEVCVSPDGTAVVAGHEDGSVAVWEPRAGTSCLVRNFTAHMGSVDAMAWSPDGHRLATAGGDEIMLWDPWTARSTLQRTRRRSSLSG